MGKLLGVWMVMCFLLSNLRTCSKPMLNEVTWSIHDLIENLDGLVHLSHFLHRKTHVGRPHVVVVIYTQKITVLVVPA